MNAAKFWSLVEKTETCWLWKGTVSPTTGYGVADACKNLRKRGQHRAVDVQAA